MNSIAALKTVNDDFQVEYEILSPIDTHISDDDRDNIKKAIQDIDVQINLCQGEVNKLNSKIDCLTNHADGLDYTVAVASGILTGFIDSFFVGELGLFNNASEEAKAKFNKAKGKANESVNKFIENYAKNRAKLKGEGSKVTDLKSAIKYLEDKFPVGQDNTWSGQGISSTHTHHLDDLAHHPTLLGLISSIMVQFFRVSFFTSKDGKVHPRIVDTSIKDLKCWMPIIISGVLKWLINLAERKDLLNFNDDVPEPVQKLVRSIYKIPAIIQVLSVVDNWFAHLVSDMGGSKQTSGGGMGIPGFFISFLKEISMLPILKDSSLPQLVNDLYASKKYTTHKIDLRTEIAVFNEQAMPIIINEIIVRTFYFVRHLVCEYKKQNSFAEINWQNVIPFGNRTVERMMTIASGTFTAVDVADAAIRSGGFNAACLLRVNFVGIGRFAIAIGVDVGMGIRRSQLMNERISIMSKELLLLNSKVYYKCAQVYYAESDMLEAEEEMWLEAQDTENTLIELYNIANDSFAYMKESIEEVQNNMNEIFQYREAIEKYNPEVKKEVINILKWGKK